MSTKRDPEDRLVRDVDEGAVRTLGVAAGGRLVQLYERERLAFHA